MVDIPSDTRSITLIMGDPDAPGSSKLDVENAMVNHILAKGELIGTYQR